jgi:hypothetical protein
MLKDSAAVYDHVFIEVVGAEIHSNQGGWMSFNVIDSVYDLLTLQNDVSVALGTQTFPPGNISQVRLILGEKDSVVVGGISYPLTLSSQDESGLKLNIHQNISAGTNYTLMIDFNATKSILQTGNGTYKLKPVLSAWFQ